MRILDAKGSALTERGNAKLLARGQAMVRDIAGIDLPRAEAALAAAGNDIKLAVLMAGGLDAGVAEALLVRSHQNLRTALDES